jgi:hypothetical protein
VGPADCGPVGPFVRAHMHAGGYEDGWSGREAHECRPAGDGQRVRPSRSV